MRNARKLKMKQHDFSDCGAACLVSICRFYGLSVSISQVRSLAGTDQQGTSVMGLLEASKKLGFESRGVKGDRKSLYKVPKPVIAHVVLEDRRHHYIIIYRTGKKTLKIMDPADGKLSSMSWSDFQSIWTGIMVLLIPSDAFQKGRKTKSPWKWFWELLKPHRNVLFHIVMGSLLYTILGLSTSVFIRVITDKVLVSGDLTLLNAMGVAMIIILILQMLLSVFKDVYIIRMGQEIDSRLILGYQEHLFGLPMRFFDAMKIGEIISRIGDAIKIRVFLSQTVMSLLINLLIIVFSYTLILYYNWKIGAFLLSMIPLYVSMFLISNILNKKSERQLMDASAKLESHLVETLQGIRTLKLFSAESYILHKSENKFLSVLKAGYSSSLNTVFSQSGAFCLQNLFTTGLLWMGSFYVLNSELSTGELLSVFSILSYLTSPMASLVSSNRSIQNAVVASDRLFDLTAHEDDQKAEGISISNIQIRDISFDEIDFQYKPGLKILHKFSVSIRAGEITAIKGKSGSGKSTLLALMQKVYPVQKGSIKIGGIDIRYISNSCLNQTIACVPQKIELFSGTIAENIALGDPSIDLHRVIDIVALLEMEDFIDRFHDGLNAIIGEGGVTLSGGQKQRIAIARALYRQPEILLLDEPSSSLDEQSERSMIRAMKKMKHQGKTVIVISHRDSTIAESDRILIMDNGIIRQDLKSSKNSNQ